MIEAIAHEVKGLPTAKYGVVFDEMIN